MSIVGADLSVANSTDPTKVGLRGTVVVESAKMLYLSSKGRVLMIEKKGSYFSRQGSTLVIVGEEILGMPEERLGRRKA